jgi:CubicO group peptidase (beta-lactamase class C family)
MLLNHQAGLPGLSEALLPGVARDFDAMVALVEQESPLWRPGSNFGYHAITFGSLLGEVVRRVTGTTIGAFFRRNVAEPLGLDFWIGLPPSEEHRVATTVMADLGAAALSPRLAEALERGDAIQRHAINSMADLLTPGACDAPGAHAAEIPAAGGIANARALARLYGALALGAESDGVELVGPDQLVQMIATESAGSEDLVTFEPSRFSAGFEKSSMGRYSLLGGSGLVLSEQAFGVSGLGGSVGFADPGARFGFGYAMNRHPVRGEPTNARYQPLIDAAYRTMGYRSFAGGKWR